MKMDASETHPPIINLAEDDEQDGDEYADVEEVVTPLENTKDTSQWNRWSSPRKIRGDHIEGFLVGTGSGDDLCNGVASSKNSGAAVGAAGAVGTVNSTDGEPHMTLDMTTFTWGITKKKVIAAGGCRKGRDELPPWLPGSSVRFLRGDRDKQPSRRALLAEKKLPKPSEPFFFLKPTSSYIVEGQDVKVPAGAVVNEEVELGVIIGKSCKNVTVNEAMNYVGGYCLALDMTEANLVADSQKKGLPWTFGKGFDTACPVSRFVSVEELKDPSDVNIWLKVNGRKIQDANTSDLAFTIPELIASITRYITLEPGDLILTEKIDYVYKDSGRKVGTFLHLLAAIISPLAMPHAKVVMSSVVRGFPSRGLTGPHTDILLSAGTILPKHTGISLPDPSQGRNVDKRRKQVKQSSPCVNETQEMEGPQPLFLVMSRLEYGDPLPKVLSDTCTPEESTLRPFPKSYSWNTPRSFALVISVAEVCLL
uniref:oxaloacetate tautomerase n=1 Tax=Timema poppense TaxID=170557 RepID=A0A7R9D6B8_TIMPO|nr:unnamed protein product [Timema poppensis]